MNLQKHAEEVAKMRPVKKAIWTLVYELYHKPAYLDPDNVKVSHALHELAGFYQICPEIYSDHFATLTAHIYQVVCPSRYDYHDGYEERYDKFVGTSDKIYCDNYNWQSNEPDDCVQVLCEEILCTGKPKHAKIAYYLNELARYHDMHESFLCFDQTAYESYLDSFRDRTPVKYQEWAYA